MTRAGRIAAALVVLGCIAGAARTASAATTLDPFRAGGKASGDRERALDPFKRVAQALPVPPAEEPAKAEAKPAKEATPAPTTSTSTSTSTSTCWTSYFGVGEGGGTPVGSRVSGSRGSRITNDREADLS